DPAPFSIDIGTSEHLVLNANGGDDVFTASNGLAKLISLSVDGGTGNDRITGGDGNDRLTGGDGNDVINGGRGNDTVFLGAGSDAATVAGDANGIDVVGLAAHVHITGAEPADKLNLNMGAGDDTVVASGLAAGAIRLTVDGGDGDDVLTGSAGIDTLLGGAG